MKRTLLVLLLVLPLLSSATTASPASPTTLRDSVMAAIGETIKPLPEEQERIRKKFDPLKMARGGTWNGGGGGGIACFKDAATAQASVDHLGRLHDHALDKVQSLSANEYYMAKHHMEASGPRYRTYVEELFKPRLDENASQFLERILIENYNSVSPLFVEYVLAALAWARPSEWSPQKSMPVVPDMGKLSVTGNCRYVQLFTRFQKTQPGSLPLGFIDADMVLWGKMSTLHGKQFAVLNQAMGMLHEALYLLGTELSHKSSEQTQALVLILMSQNFAEYLKEEKRPDILYVQLADFNFHHFANILTPVYLQKLKTAADPQKIYSKATRFQSYGSLKKKMDDMPERFLPDLLRKDPENPMAVTLLMNVGMPAFFGSEYTTEEEAFIGASFFMSVPPQKIPNPEVLISLQYPEEPYLKKICQTLREWLADSSKLGFERDSELVQQSREARIKHQTKAIKYCEKIGF